MAKSIVSKTARNRTPLKAVPKPAGKPAATITIGRAEALDLWKFMNEMRERVRGFLALVTIVAENAEADDRPTFGGSHIETALVGLSYATSPLDQFIDDLRGQMGGLFSQGNQNWDREEGDDES